MSELSEVDAATLTAKLTFEDVKADVLNVVPPQRAGRIAADAGLITANNRWCGVDFLTYESSAVKNVHVLGDAAESRIVRLGDDPDLHASTRRASTDSASAAGRPSQSGRKMHHWSRWPRMWRSTVKVPGV